MPRPNLNDPPKWRLKQLEIAGAIHVGKVQPSTLANDLLPLLKRDRWEVEDEVYELLLPSIRLASLWIELGLPYIARFLPSDRLHDELALKDVEEIPTRPGLALSDTKIAHSELAEIAKSTRWQVDYAMRKNNGWLGITRTTPQSRPWCPIFPEDVFRHDAIAKKKGAKRRPLIVGIMGEYVEALRAYEDTDEKHLRAAFMAAYTIMHEVGHVIWWQDFRAYDSELAEPFVGDDCWKELGLAFGAWVFRGFNPTSADLPGKNWYEFDTHAYWEEHRTPRSELTPWKPLYSISMEFMEMCFSKSFWAKSGEVGSVIFFRKARDALTPNLFNDPPPAVAMEIQFGNLEDYGEDDDYEDFYEDQSYDNGDNVYLAWKRKPYDRSEWGHSKVWDWLSPEDRLWVQGKGKRWVDASTGVETTGDIGRYIQDPSGERPVRFQLPKPKRKENPKFESLIEATVLDQDVPLSTEQLERPKFQGLVRIRVRHQPLEPVTAPLKPLVSLLTQDKRGRQIDSDEQSFGEPSKKLKSRDFAISDEVDEKLEVWSVRNLEGTFTHQTAYDWCQKHGIDFGELFDNAHWQMEQLNYSKNGDKYLIERIRYAVLTLQQVRYQGGSPDEVKALLRLKYELKESVPNWGPKACKSHCLAKGLAHDGTREEILARIKNWYTKDIEETVSRHQDVLEKVDTADETFDTTHSTLGKDDYLRYRLHPATTDDAIDRAIAKSGIDKWGSAKCKHERYIRYQYLRRTGDHPSRSTSNIASRTFGGVETYFFTCNLYSSTVGELRSALFVEGRFPHNAKLSLLRDFKRHGPLDDNSNTLAQAIPYYGESVIELQLTSDYSLPGKSFAGDRAPISIYKPRNQPSATNKVVDPALHRKADIIAGRAVPTLAERIQNAQEFGVALDKATTVEGGRDVLRPYKQGIKSTSAAEILDNLHEIVEARREFVEVMGTSEHVSDGSVEEEDDEPAQGVSHMADLFRKV